MSVTIGQSDIDEMLELYDSGMTDVTTSNAIALALQRNLRPINRVHVLRDADQGRYSCQIADTEFLLPKKLYGWLEDVEHGLKREPITFEVDLAEMEQSLQ